MLLGENTLRGRTSEQMADCDELFRQAILTSREELRFKTNPETLLTVVSLLIPGKMDLGQQSGHLVQCF